MFTVAPLQASWFVAASIILMVGPVQLPTPFPVGISALTVAVGLSIA